MFRRLFNISRELVGASHSDEMGYLYDFEFLRDPPIEIGSIEDIAIRRMVSLWGNFVIYGNPTPKGNKLNFQWKPATYENFYYLHFGSELSLKKNPAEDRMRLWRKVYKSNATTQGYFP